MSVILYKDGETTKVPPEFVDSHVSMGWSLKNRDEQQDHTEDDQKPKARKARAEADPV